MKIWIPTNPLWYFAVIILSVPLVAVTFGGDIWMIRLLAYGAIAIGIPLILLFFGVTNYMERSTREDAPLVKRYGKSRVVFAWRALFLTLATVFALATVPNLAKDIVEIFQGDAPLSRVAQVAEKRGSPLTGLFYQTIIFGDAYSQNDNALTEFAFPPDYFVVGQRYEIRYLPHSRTIIQATLVK